MLLRQLPAVRPQLVGHQLPVNEIGEVLAQRLDGRLEELPALTLSWAPGQPAADEVGDLEVRPLVGRSCRAEPSCPRGTPH